MRKVKLAVVGAGVIGKRHVAAIAASGRAELVAVADPFPAAAEIAKKSSVPFYEDTESMLTSAKPDGVVVSTPTEHHLQPTLATLEAGAHVLVEKPIMATLEDAKCVIDKSEQSGKHVLVGHHRRYYSQVHKARELVQDGALGQLIAISGQWGMRKHDSYYAEAWRQRWEAGPVLTNLIHEMDALRYICGDVDSISAETSNLVQNFEKEDVAAIVIRFKSGALGTFILSDRSTSPWSWEYATGENPAFPKTGQNAVRFMGTNASLEFPNLALWHHGESTADWNHPMQCSEIPNTLDDAFLAQINHFAGVILDEEPPRITAHDATETLRATLAVFEAASTGHRVML